jgi:eukaryotic-like serine/threonine-protein kinase
MASAGTILAGRYRLGEVIGRGGMSTVYRAHDATLDRTVAIKVMSAALAEQDPVWIARFLREARAVASLTHPGVATVYDTGVENGMRFIAMELVPGRSLQAILADEAPLATARAVDIGAQVADVLSAAHAAGIVHRDIKPGNVMVAPNGSVKVLDFGIARAVDGATLTQTHSLVGTVAFMSPEQALGRPADARSDIYSLGCVIYAMLAATPPFMAEVTAAVLHQHTSVAPKPLRDMSRNVPSALDALVMQMLAKDPADRPQTAAEVRDGLRATLDPTAPTAVIAALPAEAATVRIPAARVPPTRRGSPGRGLAIGALALLALVIAVIAVVALTSGGSSTSGTSASSQTSTPAAPPTTAPGTTSPSSSSTTSSSTSTSTTSTTPSTTTSTTSSSTTTPSATTSPAPTTTPPGHGGTPPGQAKKRG